MSAEHGAGIHYLAPSASKSWFGRVIAFSRQMFPFYPNVITFLLQFCVHYFLLRQVFGGISSGRSVALDLICGSLTAVFFVYLFRVFDELKDYPTDKINFPDRPLVSGVMNVPDAHRLWQATTLLLLLLQIPIFRPSIGVAVAIILTFSFLAFQWFFAESKIRPSLPLALVTHNPILYLYQVYTLAFFWPWAGDGLTAAILFVVGDAMTGTAWEISRKIRGTLEEDNYVTYSRVWGRGPALFLTGLFCAGSATLTLGSLSSRLPPTFFWACVPAALIFLGFVVASLKFLAKPDRAPPFKRYVEALKLSLLVAYLIGLLL